MREEGGREGMREGGRGREGGREGDKWSGERERENNGASMKNMTSTERLCGHLYRNIMLTLLVPHTRHGVD